MSSGADMNVYEDVEEANAEHSRKYLAQQRLNIGIKERSDGSTASYYELPENATELQDLISYKDMNSQIGEIFRECYRYGMASHSDEIRGIKKILFYAKAELERLQKLNNGEIK
jgi:hypothetical protein